MNGVGRMRSYMKALIKKYEPDIIMLTEAKRQYIIDLAGDLACNPQVYRVVQLDITVHHRGGIMIIIKNP